MRVALKTIEGGRRVRTIDWSRRPNTFTSQEQVIERLSEMILTSNIPVKKIAAGCDVSGPTIYNLASRQTLWPRAKTLFGVLKFFDAELHINVPPKSAASRGRA